MTDTAVLQKSMCCEGVILCRALLFPPAIEIGSMCCDDVKNETELNVTPMHQMLHANAYVTLSKLDPLKKQARTANAVSVGHISACLSGHKCPPSSCILRICSRCSVFKLGPLASLGFRETVLWHEQLQRRAQTGLL